MDWALDLPVISKSRTRSLAEFEQMEALGSATCPHLVPKWTCLRTQPGREQHTLPCVLQEPQSASPRFKSGAYLSDDFFHQHWKRPFPYILMEINSCGPHMVLWAYLKIHSLIHPYFLLGMREVPCTRNKCKQVEDPD
jgi:hypothetical protein